MIGGSEKPTRCEHAWFQETWSESVQEPTDKNRKIHLANTYTNAQGILKTSALNTASTECYNVWIKHRIAQALYIYIDVYIADFTIEISVTAFKRTYFSY
jgi:hypothetical protein